MREVRLLQRRTAPAKWNYASWLPGKPLTQNLKSSGAWWTVNGWPPQEDTGGGQHKACHGATGVSTWVEWRRVLKAGGDGSGHLGDKLWEPGSDSHGLQYSHNRKHNQLESKGGETGIYANRCWSNAPRTWVGKQSLFNQLCWENHTANAKNDRRLSLTMDKNQPEINQRPKTWKYGWGFGSSSILYFLRHRYLFNMKYMTVFQNMEINWNLKISHALLTAAE